MKKTDARQWQYVKPLLKSDYDLFVRTDITDREVYGYELELGRVQSIKVNKKTGRLEVVVKVLSQ